MLDSEVFIPNKYVVIRGNDVWMEKPFSVPPIQNSQVYISIPRHDLENRMKEIRISF